MLLVIAQVAEAQPTNALPDAELQGRALVQRILRQWPSVNSTNTGNLRITDGDDRRSTYPVVFTVLVSNDSWRSLCTSPDLHEQVVIVHNRDLSTAYFSSTEPGGELKLLTGAQIYRPISRSDFWLCDLGLEFFQWPGQKVLKKEFHRNCPCIVLESTNPDPLPGGYSRVVSWIDEDSLGIVESVAYDAKGAKLKKFYPKSLEKVKGQYQVKSMDMENLQTGSVSRLEFDLDQ